jgi:hypothetical protein
MRRSRTLKWMFALGEVLRGLLVFPPHVFDSVTGARLGAVARQQDELGTPDMKATRRHQ